MRTRRRADRPLRIWRPYPCRGRTRNDPLTPLLGVAASLSVLMGRSRWLPRSGFVATLAVGVGLVGSSLYGLAEVGHDLEVAAADRARPATAFVVHRHGDCPGRTQATERDLGDRL